MPAAAAMSRVPVAAKPLLRKSLAAPSISWRWRLPSLRSCVVLRGRPRGRRGGGAVTTAAGGPGAGSAVLWGRAGRLASERAVARMRRAGACMGATIANRLIFSKQVLGKNGRWRPGCRWLGPAARGSHARWRSMKWHESGLLRRHSIPASSAHFAAIAPTNDGEMESKSAEIGLALLHERRKRLPRCRLAQHAAKAGGLLRHGREHLRALAAFHQALGLDQRRQRLARQFAGLRLRQAIALGGRHHAVDQAQRQ